MNILDKETFVSIANLGGNLTNLSNLYDILNRWSIRKDYTQNLNDVKNEKSQNLNKSFDDLEEINL